MLCGNDPPPVIVPRLDGESHPDRLCHAAFIAEVNLNAKVESKALRYNFKSMFSRFCDGLKAFFY